MSYELTIYRVPEMKGNAMAFKVYVDGEKTAQIDTVDETLVLQLATGPHTVQVKMWPNYFRSTPIQVDESVVVESPIFFTGFTEKPGFGSLMRGELKLLPENEFKSMIKPVKPWPQLSSQKMLFVLFTSLITGGHMIFASQSQILDEDSSFLALILGVGTAIGGFSAYYFNQSKTDSNFAYHKPASDAIALLIFMLMLDMWTTEWYVSGALIIVAMRLWFYLKMTRK